MKATIILLIGLVLGAVIGWFLGFLQMPYVEKIPSFLMGFIACALIVLLILALLFVRKKRSSLLRVIGGASVQQDSKTPIRTSANIWILSSAFIVAGILLSSFLMHRQSKVFKAQLQKQDSKIQEQSELIESVRKSNMVALMSNILQNAQEELKNNHTLSDAVIARIAALSSSLKPYKYLEGDSLSAKELSPERGQLLIELILMKMDSGSFDRIKQRASFANADLGDADLKRADLSSANLSSANLKDADAGDVNLSNADLKDANLSGAKLNNANLSKANLKRSDLRWAELNGTDLKYADLDGAQMTSAQLIKADVRNASIQWAYLEGALLSEANLTGVNLTGTEMRKVTLNKADLTRTDLRSANLNEANLIGTEWNRALVDSNWMDKLNDWRVADVKEIQERYSVIADTTDQWKHNIYRVRKIEKSGMLLPN